MIFIFQALLTLIYLIKVKPFEQRFKNLLEIFNETCLLIASYMTILFSPMIDDVDLQYNIGWFLTALVTFQIVINMTVMVVQTIKTLIIMMRKLISRIEKLKRIKKTVNIGIRNFTNSSESTFFNETNSTLKTSINSIK